MGMLAMVCARELSIESFVAPRFFVPRRACPPFYLVHLDHSAMHLLVPRYHIKGKADSKGMVDSLRPSLTHCSRSHTRPGHSDLKRNVLHEMIPRATRPLQRRRREHRGRLERRLGRWKQTRHWKEEKDLQAASGTYLQLRTGPEQNFMLLA